MKIRGPSICDQADHSEQAAGASQLMLLEEMYSLL